jgi:hypothetical protein
MGPARLLPDREGDAHERRTGERAARDPWAPVEQREIERQQ